MENKEAVRISFYCYFLLVSIIVSCNNSASSNTDAKVTDTARKSADTIAATIDTAATITIGNGTHCFAYTQNNDSVFLSLVIKDNRVTGKLIYRLSEKDANRGTIKGSFRGDTLLADYTFLSEGTQSVRQVIFLRKGNILEEGNGNMKEQGNKLVFIKTTDVNFNGNIILKPVDCNILK